MDASPPHCFYFHVNVPLFPFHHARDPECFTTTVKNDKTATTKSLAGLPCRKRVLLSGTPMQNDLEEFFAMVDFTNPGVLGTCSEFRRKYQSPILNGASAWMYTIQIK
jgi:SNF2 family DNA or RNA helicase